MLLPIQGQAETVTVAEVYQLGQPARVMSFLVKRRSGYTALSRTDCSYRVGSDSNALDFYSGGARFDSRPGNGLSEISRGFPPTAGIVPQIRP
jgi:hypothetical protein